MEPAAHAGNLRSGRRPSMQSDDIERAVELMRQALLLIDGASSFPARSGEGSGVGEHDRLIRLPEVLRLTGMCRSALYSQMAQGQFPRSIKIGPRAASWSLNEVRRWIGLRTG